MWQLRGRGRGEVTCRGTPPAVGYLRCSRPRSASPPKRPPNRSASPAASGRRPNPPVGGSTAAPYWAPAAPYWYWAVAAPCAIAGAATSSVRRASIVARYRALFMASAPSRKPRFPIMKISMWASVVRSRPPYETTLVTTLYATFTLILLQYLTCALNKEHLHP